VSDGIPAFRQPGLEFTTEPVHDQRTTSPAPSDRMQAADDDAQYPPGSEAGFPPWKTWRT